MTIKDIEKDLKNKKITGEIFTLGNLFIGQDTLPDENIIEKLTGFSGSYAILFITQTKSYIFVDGRYELQVKKEINLHQTEIVKLSEISFLTWLKNNFNKKGTLIRYNPWTISIQNLDNLKKTLPNVNFIPNNEASPLLSSSPAKTFIHQKKFSGLSVKEKLTTYTSWLKEKNLDAYLVTDAANVSWLLNMRSNALPYTPIFRAYALIEKNGHCTVFAENTDYKASHAFSELATILPKYKNLGIDFTSAPAKINDITNKIINIKDKITVLKAIKNKTELRGFCNAHVRDGVALSKFICWLSKNYKGKTETEIAEKLSSFRKKELNFYTESFATIAGFGSNAAVVHYHADKKHSATLKKNNVLLLDSGGQYYDGTTDVTRTIALGDPTPDMIEKNTLVLKAHIALATAIFHKETTGNELDLIARQPLLKYGLDFEHGTGHGVGCFSNVHEGPARISIHAKQNAPLTAGMITSIEPGYYKENSFGIRIENLYYVKPTKNPKYLTFEVLTLAPIDIKLINKYMLSSDEINWLNHYHHQVFLSLRKYLTKQELEWLKKACAPI